MIKKVRGHFVLTPKVRKLFLKNTDIATLYHFRFTRYIYIYIYIYIFFHQNWFLFCTFSDLWVFPTTPGYFLCVPRTLWGKKIGFPNFDKNRQLFRTKNRPRNTKKWPSDDLFCIYSVIYISYICGSYFVYFPTFGYFQPPPGTSYRFLGHFVAKKWDSKILIKICSFISPKIDPETPKRSFSRI